MNENLKAKIAAKLGILSDEHGRQLLDFIDFLQSKYNRSRRTPSPFQRLAENIEDALGGTTVTDAASKGTAQVVDTAGRVMAGLVAAGRAVADELAGQPRTAEPPPDAQSNGGTKEQHPTAEEPRDRA